MQVNQALPLLLDLLLQECRDSPGSLEVLLGHLPQPDLRSVLKEASETGYVSSLNLNMWFQTNHFTNTANSNFLWALQSSVEKITRLP